MAGSSGHHLHHHHHHHHHHHQDDSSHHSLQNIQSVIMEISNQVALFRDLLINIGQSQDSPELREKIRKLRRNCVEMCKSTSQRLMTTLVRNESDEIPDDDPHLVLLFFILQLFLRELSKCHRLVQVIPMDMTGYYDNRTGPSNLGNVISQIILCKQITPDFNREELCSIAKDSKDIGKIIEDIQEFMPVQEQNLERTNALATEQFEWTKRRKGTFFCNDMNFLCCLKKPKYL